MKCNDCGNLGWGNDEGELVYGWCKVRQYCPDLGLEKNCSSFIKKRPDALATLQAENAQLRADLEYEREHANAYHEECGQWEAENEKLRAELEQVKQESDAAVSDMETIMAYGGGNLDTCQYCKNGQCYVRGGTKLCLPKWRGPQKED